MTTTLIAPGLRSSGPEHWQTWFEQQLPGVVRVIQRDWSDARIEEWSSRIRLEISRHPGRIVIVGHSFGALAAVQAAFDHSERIAALMLVAPADPAKFGVEDVLPRTSLPFPTALVASSDDPWISITRAAHLADEWGADLINIGAAGHINAESGFGPWPEGLAIYERLRRAGVRAREIHDQPAAPEGAAPRAAAATGQPPRFPLHTELVRERGAAPLWIRRPGSRTVG